MTKSVAILKYSPCGYGYALTMFTIFSLLTASLQKNARSVDIFKSQPFTTVLLCIRRIQVFPFTGRNCSPVMQSMFFMRQPLPYDYSRFAIRLPHHLMRPTNALPIHKLRVYLNFSQSYTQPSIHGIHAVGLSHRIVGIRSLMQISLVAGC